MSSPIEVTIGPAPAFRLLGLPERFTEGTMNSLRLPPCPACGQTIALDMIEVTAFGDGSRTFFPGPWECPNGCDPKYRRFVIAANWRDFEHFCREHGWNPRRVLFVSTDRYGRGEQQIRGQNIHPGMIHQTYGAQPDERLQHEIMTRIHRDARWSSIMYNAFNINLIAIDHPSWVARSIRLGGHRLPWSGAMVEAERPALDPESERWPDAYRWIPR